MSQSCSPPQSLLKIVSEQEGIDRTNSEILLASPDRAGIPLLNISQWLPMRLLVRKGKGEGYLPSSCVVHRGARL